MTDYGVTPTGFVPKRLDVILNEIHTDLSKGWGVNTRLNPKSYLNVQVTAFADKIAELWELGADIYHAMYPYSAENISLDNAVQYGGITREDARPTYYPVHAECVDGTAIPRGAMIRSDTNPAISFIAAADTMVTRSAFNRVGVRVAAVEKNIYTVVLNGTIYSCSGTGDDTEEDIVARLAAAITDTDFTITVSGKLLTIASIDEQKSNELVLSGNLTTQSVTAIVNFASETNGEVSLPAGTITKIVTAIPGFLSVVNRINYIAGRLRETDAELRISYIDKIFHRSNRMLESIRSAILLNVQGVNSVAVYQNDTNVIDADGRWPHCVEIVIDGGADYEIAWQIWERKAAGIQTFGNTEITVPGNEGEAVIVRFNRPEYVYVWFNIAITLNRAETLPTNYIEAIKEIIIAEMSKIEPGKPVIPQRLIDAEIYGTVPGIGFIETTTFYSTDASEQPGAYAPGMVPITARQRAVTEDTRIEVVISG